MNNGGFDPVEKPLHYNTGAIECLDAIASALGKEGFEYYLTGNIMKYLWRWRHKNGLEDLKKANFYLLRLIKSKEEKENG